MINRKYVGRDASVILRDSGVSFTGNPRLVIAEVDRNHPFVMTEMLMPVLAIVRVKDIDEAVGGGVPRGAGPQALRDDPLHQRAQYVQGRAEDEHHAVRPKTPPATPASVWAARGITTMTIAPPPRGHHHREDVFEAAPAACSTATFASVESGPWT